MPLQNLVFAVPPENPRLFAFPFLYIPHEDTRKEQLQVTHLRLATLAGVLSLLLITLAPAQQTAAVAKKPAVKPAAATKQTTGRPPAKAPAKKPPVVKRPVAKPTPKPTPKPKPPKLRPPKTGLLKQFLNGPMKDVDEIVFAVRTLSKNGHWYANIGYWCNDPENMLTGDGGQLVRLNLRTKKQRVLIDDPKGSIRDPQVSYDGKRILFSWRKNTTDYFHLYEMNIDGTRRRQLTDGPYDDIEPTYLPDGDIMFGSTRCFRWVNCFLTQVATIYKCDGDGQNIRMISSNNEHDNTPWPLPDGRVLYTRWEYIDRSQMVFHHLWAMNADGTNQTVYFGNQNPGYVMIDGKPIPGTNKIVATFSPKHGRNEHTGEVRIVDPDQGPDHAPSARRVTDDRIFGYRDPWAFSEDCLMIANDRRLIVMNGEGDWEPILYLTKAQQERGLHVHEPRPIIARERERLISPRVDLAKDTGNLILSDITYGRNMGGVKPGDVKKLLVLEVLPMPVHFQGGMRPITMGGSFTLERVMGTVPVEADGSAYVELPALRSFFFVALDKNDDSVKRMHSFVTVQPGETTSCAGCHEHRAATPQPRPNRSLLALQREPSKIETLPGIPEVYDFPRDIQPILDRNCVGCHNPDDYKGGVSLAGDRGGMFSHSYVNLTLKKQFADGRNRERGDYPPRTIGAVASPLMAKLKGGHKNVKATPEEIAMVRWWIESAAVYPGTYAALATGSISELIWKTNTMFDVDLPSVKATNNVRHRRCNMCHVGPIKLGWAASNLSNSKFGGHLMYNLSRPEKSMLVTAPLDKAAGGLGICRAKSNRFPAAKKFYDKLITSKDDKDWQTMLSAVRDTKAVLDKRGRFDMPHFRPRREYIREMQRYGILPKDLEPDDPIDIYATDEAYWQSLWYEPVAARAD